MLFPLKLTAWADSSTLAGEVTELDCSRCGPAFCRPGGDPGLATEVVVDAATQLRGHFLDAVFRQVGNDLRCFHRRVSLPLDQYPSGGQKQLRAG